MLSPAVAAELESLALTAARALAEIIEHSTREAPRVSAALGLLRLIARLPPAAHPPAAPPHAASPETDPPSASARGRAPRQRTPRPPEPAAATAPLTPVEIAELREQFPYIDPARFERADSPDAWRAHLAQARRWDAHWRAQRKPAAEQPPARDTREPDPP